MNQATFAAATPHQPRWRWIVEHPLVAMLIALVMFAAAITVANLIDKLLPPMDKQAQLTVRSVIAVALLIGVYKFGMARLGEHPRDDLPLDRTATGLPLGFLFAVALFSVVVGVAALIGVYRIVGLGDTSQLFVAMISLAIMPGFLEELLFRGILFRWLEDFGGSWLALALTSILFGAGHIFNPGATWFSSIAIAVEAGILLGGAYMLTRNLWMAMGLHAGWNFTQGEIYDVPVSGLDQAGLVTARMSGSDLMSGGSFGLEASPIALVRATGAGVVLVVMAVRAGHTVQPRWVRRRLLQADALARSEEVVGIDVDRDAHLGAPLDLRQPGPDNVLHV
jgi:membrane protease YdiL (CAAX protease family)